MVSVHSQPRLLNYSLEGVKIKVVISLLNLIHRTMKWAGVFGILIGIRNYFGELLFSIRVSLRQREKFLYLSLYSCAWFAFIGHASTFSGRHKFNGSAHFSPCCVLRHKSNPLSFLLIGALRARLSLSFRPTNKKMFDVNKVYFSVKNKWKIGEH